MSQFEFDMLERSNSIGAWQPNRKYRAIPTSSPRLTTAFSKKAENHGHAVELHFMYYNFGRIHKTLRVTVAIVAGVADDVWSLEEIAAL